MLKIRRSTILVASGVTCIATAATVLRLMHVGDSLWLDELHTAWTVCDGIREVPTRAAMGNQSPLYFFGLWMLVQLFGLSEPVLRCPSVVAGVLLVLSVAWVAYRWTGSGWAACLAAWLVALDQNCLFYSQEARPYAWVQWIGLLQVTVFCAVLHSPTSRRRWAGIALSILLFYLHYTSALLLVAEAVAYLGIAWMPGVRPHYRPRRCLMDGLIVLAACLPVTMHLLEIAERRDNWAAFVRDRPFDEIASAFFPLWTYLTLPAMIAGAAFAFVGLGWLIAPRGTRRVLQPPRSGAAHPLEPGKPDLDVPVLLTGNLINFFTSTSDQRERATRFRAVARICLRPCRLSGRHLATVTLVCLCWLFVPLLFHICPTAYWKAVLFSTLAAVSLSQSGIIESLVIQGRAVPGRNQDWRGAIAWLEESASHSSGPVFVRSGLIEAERLRDAPVPKGLHEYCLLPLGSLYRVSLDEDRLIPLPLRAAGRLTDSQRGLVRSHGEAWFLVAGSGRTVDAVIKDVQRYWQRPNDSLRVAHRTAFGAVSVVHLQADCR